MQNKKALAEQIRKDTGEEVQVQGFRLQCTLWEGYDQIEVITKDGSIYAALVDDTEEPFTLFAKMPNSKEAK